jgi:anti-sigma B factor antagonist
LVIMDIAKHQRLDGSYLLVLAGECDLACVDAVRRAGLSLIEHEGCKGLVIDLMDVSFIDSTGLSALVALRNAANAKTLPLHILDPSDQVTRVLQVTGLDQIFNIELTSRVVGQDRVGYLTAPTLPALQGLRGVALPGPSPAPVPPGAGCRR